MQKMKSEDRAYVLTMAFLIGLLAIVAICLTAYQMAALKANCPAEAQIQDTSAE